ncbi:MAG: shikimate dehydrogenase [Pyrinomonadaceae bacterium]
MNEKRLCISICAGTARQFIDNVRRAAERADVIELRLDCIDPAETDRLWSQLKDVRSSFSGKLLATYRPRGQGGLSEATVEQRHLFWRDSKVYEFVDWADFEHDLAVNNWGQSDAAFGQLIHSFHDFHGVPENLELIYAQLSQKALDKYPNKHPGVVKIVTYADDATDALPVWELLNKANRDGLPFVPIAMGEAGKWTRILGPAHGAFMTYASLDLGLATAPGQISASDLLDSYHVKNIDRDTGVYGIVAGNTAYSMSPFIHNAAFKAAGSNAVFVPFQVIDLDQFFGRMVNAGSREIDLNIKGFAVTNPHKQCVIRHLDHVDKTAAAIGAVNTVKIEDNKTYGFNTDADGFIIPLKEKLADLKGAKVAVVGAGGAARACIYALVRESASVTIFARNTERSIGLANEFDTGLERLTLDTDLRKFDVVVNATPLGVRGDRESESIAFADQLAGVKVVYDLTYNPVETVLTREAKAAGAAVIGGLDMLIGQAADQFKIWMGIDAPIDTMRSVVVAKIT